MASEGGNRGLQRKELNDWWLDVTRPIEVFINGFLFLHVQLQ